MADKNSIQDGIAEAVHRAEAELRAANTAPAGAGRIERLNKAYVALDAAEQAYDNVQAKQGYFVPQRR
jgi:hypothetical protein